MVSEEANQALSSSTEMDHLLTLSTYACRKTEEGISPLHPEAGVHVQKAIGSYIATHGKDVAVGGQATNLISFLKNRTGPTR